MHILVRRLVNQPRLVLPARETFYALAKGDFDSFVERLSRTLLAAFDASLKQPFLEVLHDMWTNAANVNKIRVAVIVH